LLLEAPPPPTVDAKTDSSTAGKSVMTINPSNISLRNWSYCSWIEDDL
jgi:hypothetical protein